jgi:hypothetical protein
MAKYRTLLTHRARFRKTGWFHEKDGRDRTLNIPGAIRLRFHIQLSTKFLPMIASASTTIKIQLQTPDRNPLISSSLRDELIDI